VTHGIPTATPGINQHSPLDRLTNHPAKKTRIINKKLKRNMQQKGQGALSTLEKGREARS
jgi:hypothetical protein